MADATRLRGLRRGLGAPPAVDEARSDLAPVVQQERQALDLLSSEDEDAGETERRRRLYVDRGFKPLLDDENRLYLSMKEIRKLGLT